jgi:hypothetical protein
MTVEGLNAGDDLRIEVPEAPANDHTLAMRKAGTTKAPGAHGTCWGAGRWGAAVSGEVLVVAQPYQCSL